MSPFDVITVIIASGWYFWEKKKRIALYICFHFTHICAAMWNVLFYFIKLVFSVLNICAFWVCLGVFFCILYIFMVSVANSHTINCIHQKVWRKSFRSEFHTFCRSPCRSSDTSMDKTIKWTFDKRLFCSVLLFSRSGINPQAHIDVYIDLWQNKVKRVSTPDRCSFKFSIYLQKYTQQIQTEKKKTKTFSL